MVLDRNAVAELLRLQAQGYRLLMWLDEQSVKDPALLSAAAVAQLREAASAAAWMARERAAIPPALLPGAAEAERFWNLFASFFATSFRVERLEFDDHLIDARLKLGAGEKAAARAGVEGAKMLAVKHLAGSQGLRLSEKEASRLVKRATLGEAALIWTYVWELDRRARHKGKGPVAHRVWRSLPWAVKRALDVEAVWAARAALLTAARALLEPPEGDPVAAAGRETDA